MALYPLEDTKLGPYWVGDVPAPVDITLQDADSEIVTLTGSTVTGEVRAAGLPGTQPVTAAVLDGAVRVAFPSTTVLTTSSVYTLELTVDGAGGTHELVDPIPFVVQQYDGWMTIADLKREWSDASNFTDVGLFRLLWAAKLQCVTYAPKLTVPEDDAFAPVPLNYVQAQLMQARNTANAFKTDPQQAADGQMFVIRPYPLDGFIKALLRPKSALPAVG